MRTQIKWEERADPSPLAPASGPLPAGTVNKWLAMLTSHWKGIAWVKDRGTLSAHPPRCPQSGGWPDWGVGPGPNHMCPSAPFTLLYTFHLWPFLSCLAASGSWALIAGCFPLPGSLSHVVMSQPEPRSWLFLWFFLCFPLTQHQRRAWEENYDWTYGCVRFN